MYTRELILNRSTRALLGLQNRARGRRPRRFDQQNESLVLRARGGCIYDGRVCARRDLGGCSTGGGVGNYIVIYSTPYTQLMYILSNLYKV